MGTMRHDPTSLGRAEPPLFNERVGERARHYEPVPSIVTISRECGAGGAEIAKRVAHALGFSCWDHELTQHLAHRAGTHARYVRAVDERARDLFDDVIATSLLGSPI